MVTKSTAPYVEIWKVEASFYTAFPSASPAVILDPALASMPSKVEISKNGEYLVVTRNVATTYTYLYRRVGQKYVRMTDPGGGGAFPVPAAAIAFTDDERNLALAVSSSSRVNRYTIDPAGPTATFVDTIAAGLINNTTILDYSSDGKYLALVGGSPASGVALNTNINLYHLNNTTATLVTPGGTFGYSGGAFADGKFSPDGRFFIATYLSGASSTKAVVLRKVSATSFTYQDSIVYTLNAGEEPSYIDFAD